MSFLSLKDVSDSFVTNCKQKFSSPDWGVICILHTISSSIIPGQSYEIDKSKLGDKLNELFTFVSKDTRSNSIVYATFSNTWLESFFGKFDNKLSLIDLAIWYYRKTNLPNSIISGAQLIDKFVADLHLPMDKLSELVDTSSDKTISLNNSLYSDDDLLKNLSDVFDFTITKDSITLKAEGSMVVKCASDFGAGPFTQTLYASKGFANTLLLTDFELSELYTEKNKETTISLHNNKELIDKVKYGFERFLKLTNKQMENRVHYINVLETELSPLFANVDSSISSIYQVVSIAYLKSLIRNLVIQDNSWQHLLAETWSDANVSSSMYKVWTIYRQYYNYLSIIDISDFRANIDYCQNQVLSAESHNISNKDKDYLRAIRTKPFLLLAGISGTGKSRIVKQMAFDSCPDNAILRKDPTSPGNYCLVEVKPNWHDSTELLGYESKIGGDHYQLTPFIKFLAKAMLHPEAPFFVCLDEMNLAPVEQYFAEFLSVLESRTKIDGHIVSEPLIKADIFKKYSLENQLFSINKDNTSNEVANSTSDPSPNYGKEYEVYELLKKDGLRIPENVVIIGTVNMDETTHQFSRKVIDRAMTIEMNLPEGNPFMDFFSNSSELTYRKQPTHASLYLATETKASDVVNALASVDAGKTEWLKGEIASFLTELNNALDGTPFKVAYRVQNELMLYFHQLWLEDQTAHWRDILNTACDQILMMKVLPRIEGDSELLEKPLTNLISFCAPYTNASKKLDEMNVRLDKSQFTSFWP